MRFCPSQMADSESFRSHCHVQACYCVFLDIDTDAVESYVAEETIEFLVNVEESVIDDE